MLKTVSIIVLALTGTMATISCQVHDDGSPSGGVASGEMIKSESVSSQQSSFVFPMFSIGQLDWRYIPQWMLSNLSDAQRRELQSCEVMGYADEPISQCAFDPLPGYRIYFIGTRIVSQELSREAASSGVMLPFDLQWSDKYDDVLRKVPNIRSLIDGYQEINGVAQRSLYLSNIGIAPDGESEYIFAFVFDRDDKLTSVAFLENLGL